MCVVCVLWKKGRLTAREADRAFLEIIDRDSTGSELRHAQEAITEILSQDTEEGKNDPRR